MLPAWNSAAHAFEISLYFRMGMTSAVMVPAFIVGVFPVESSSQTFQYRS